MSRYPIASMANLRRVNSRIGKLLPNLLLALVSFGVTLLIVEFAVIPRALPFLPLKVHAGLPQGFRVLAQSSKRSAVPEDYVALLGDSYAQGMGDWFLSVNPNRNPPFHSAHLIQEATGRDVVTFGMSGSGSLRALVTEPVTNLAFLEETALLAPGDPDALIVYFYEGNDLNDNILDLKLRFEPSWDIDRVRDPEYFRKFIDETVIGESPMHAAKLDFAWTDNFVLTRFVGRVIDAALFREWESAAEEIDFSVREVNRAWVGGEAVPIPDLLQAPALDLTEAELSLALYVYGRAFDFFATRFRTSKLGVVYIPSPLASYRIASPRVRIQVQSEGSRDDVYEASEVAERSDRICEQVAAIARSHGVAFVDLRPALWGQGEKEFLHGPRDWKHLNARGQEILADAAVALLDAVESGTPVGDPGKCASMREWL